MCRYGWFNSANLGRWGFWMICSKFNFVEFRSKSSKIQFAVLTFLSLQTLSFYPLNHLSKWYDKGLTFSRITSLHLSTRFISKSGKIEWIFSRIKGGEINFVKCQISLWKSETTNQLSVSLHFKFVLIKVNFVEFRANRPKTRLQF